MTEDRTDAVTQDAIVALLRKVARDITDFGGRSDSGRRRVQALHTADTIFVYLNSGVIEYCDCDHCTDVPGSGIPPYPPSHGPLPPLTRRPDEA